LGVVMFFTYPPFLLPSFTGWVGILFTEATL
jgi:hypothetical protein